MTADGAAGSAQHPSRTSVLFESFLLGIGERPLQGRVAHHDHVVDDRFARIHDRVELIQIGLGSTPSGGETGVDHEETLADRPLLARSTLRR